MEKTYNIHEYDTWKFIEENLPNYHHRDDVLYNDLVSRYVNGEELEDADFEMINNRFNGNYTAAEQWLDNDIERLFMETCAYALENGKIATITIIQK